MFYFLFVISKIQIINSNHGCRGILICAFSVASVWRVSNLFFILKIFEQAYPWPLHFTAGLCCSSPTLASCQLSSAWRLLFLSIISQILIYSIHSSKCPKEVRLLFKTSNVEWIHMFFFFNTVLVRVSHFKTGYDCLWRTPSGISLHLWSLGGVITL